MELFNGDIRELFDTLDNDVDKIKNFIQKENKKSSPIYLEQKYAIIGCM